MVGKRNVIKCYGSMYEGTCYSYLTPGSSVCINNWEIRHEVDRTERENEPTIKIYTFNQNRNAHQKLLSIQMKKPPISCY